jgi:hypothetical protein
MRIVLAALVPLVATLAVAHAQSSTDQARQKRVAKTDPHPHCRVDRGGYCYNYQVATYMCITRAQCADLERMDHAWSWRTAFRFFP